MHWHLSHLLSAPARARASAWRYLRGDHRCLADFDEVAVGVAQVAAELHAPVCRRGQELSPSCAPLLIDGIDVGDADVEEAADPIWVGRRLKRHRRLVISGR